MKNKDMQEKIALQEDMQRRVEDKKKEINAKIHERKLLNGDLVTQEEAERKAKDEVQMYQQQLTKIRFKKQSYAIGMQKLSQENIKLEKGKLQDRMKYLDKQRDEEKSKLLEQISRLTGRVEHLEKESENNEIRQSSILQV